MDNYLDSIMQPYLGRKSEINRKLSTIDSRIEGVNKKLYELQLEKNRQVRILELRLEKLRDNKAREIEEYIEEYVNSKPSPYYGYVEKVSKDLEQAYKERENSLEKEIVLAQAQPEEELAYINEIKSLTLAKEELLNTQEKLNDELKNADFKLVSLMVELRNFKYEYDNNHSIINKAEHEDLLNRITAVSQELDGIRKAMNKLDEQISSFELNGEFDKSVIERVTNESQSKKQEDIISEESTLVESVIGIVKEIDTPEIKSSVELPIPMEPPVDTISGDLAIEESETSKYSSETEQESTVVLECDEPSLKVEKLNRAQRQMYKMLGIVPVDQNNTKDRSTSDVNSAKTYTDLIKLIFDEVKKEAQDIQTMRLTPTDNPNIHNVEIKQNNGEYKVVTTVSGYDSDADKTLKLPNGELFNSDEMYEALNKFLEKNKGKTYIVKDTGKKLKITERKMKKVKKAFVDSCMLYLKKDDTRKTENITEIYAKDNQSTSFKKQKIGEMANSELEYGYYVSQDGVLDALGNLRTKFNLQWLKKLSNKLKLYRDTYEDKFDLNLDEEQENKQKKL